MDFKILFYSLIVLVICKPLQSLSQEKKTDTQDFCRQYLKERKNHPGVNTNSFVGQARPRNKNTYIQKQLISTGDPSIYNSYWPLIGDTLLYVSPEEQKICVVNEIDSCDLLNSKYKNQSRDSTKDFFDCEFFDCAIVAKNLKRLDSNKTCYSTEHYCFSYAFKYKPGLVYTPITKEGAILKICDSVKVAQGNSSHSNLRIKFNLKKGLMTSANVKDTISKFEVLDIILLSNRTIYFELHEDYHDDDEAVELYLYTNGTFTSVIDASED